MIVGWKQISNKCLTFNHKLKGLRMRKNFFTMALAVIAMAFMGSTDAEAQLPEGNIGVGASIGANDTGAQIFYALEENMDIALTLGYSSKTPDGGDAADVLNIGLQYRYLFLEPANTIDPYLSVGLIYGTNANEGDDYNTLFIQAAYGLQAELVKNVYLFAQIGLGFGMENSVNISDEDITNTEINFGGSRLGAIIYMQD
jgi:hypothetical protein